MLVGERKSEVLYSSFQETALKDSRLDHFATSLLLLQTGLWS